MCVCVCVCVRVRVCVLVTQLCPTLCNLLDCNAPSFSVHGILQARILEWVVMPFSRGTFQPRDQTCISYVSCVAGGFFTADPRGKKFNFTSTFTPNSSLVSLASGFPHWKLPMRDHQFVGSLSRHPCWPQL